MDTKNILIKTPVFRSFFLKLNYLKGYFMFMLFILTQLVAFGDQQKSGFFQCFNPFSNADRLPASSSSSSNQSLNTGNVMQDLEVQEKVLLGKTTKDDNAQSIAFKTQEKNLSLKTIERIEIERFRVKNLVAYLEDEYKSTSNDPEKWQILDKYAPNFCKPPVDRTPDNCFNNLYNWYKIYLSRFRRIWVQEQQRILSLDCSSQSNRDCKVSVVYAPPSVDPNMPAVNQQKGGIKPYFFTSDDIDARFKKLKEDAASKTPLEADLNEVGKAMDNFKAFEPKKSSLSFNDLKSISYTLNSSEASSEKMPLFIPVKTDTTNTQSNDAFDNAKKIWDDVFNNFQAKMQQLKASSSSANLMNPKDALTPDQKVQVDGFKAFLENPENNNTQQIKTQTSSASSSTGLKKSNINDSTLFFIGPSQWDVDNKTKTGAKLLELW